VEGITLAPPPESCPALVLNADYRPLSYYPLSLWSWQDAVKAVFLGRVTILSEYQRVVKSPSYELRLPSVIALKDYVTPTRHPAFTRFNVFLRDSFQCQYCLQRHPTNELTFDHVLPKSKGGITSWDNVVTACSLCNTVKGCRTLNKCGLHLYRFPRKPTAHELHKNGQAFPPNYLHESWRDYLYWDTVLEEA
jgi:5-methylcytosine-specific restriction endonuclease McrA